MNFKENKYSFFGQEYISYIYETNKDKIIICKYKNIKGWENTFDFTKIFNLINESFKVKYYIQFSYKSFNQKLSKRKA